MVLDSLSDRLKESLKKITNIGLVDKKAVIELSSDIKKALIAADVNITLAKEIAQKIRDCGTGQEYKDLEIFNPKKLLKKML
ncbi:hypothetical protein HN924_01205 [Candidatus Woesearchaeota archaeon]|jgi:signal recognition particle subunit SRP54|nr:hypothetical protein [Candidatus Woesearchaeota archaeon]MBT7062566.1 hypothetical protein [Candidatus Woesearchaeota archaeon]MBT7402359.1 hypothetical protein [Candidatus Woesearchaeota archaeon]